jgi:RHS repeat-associated protein
VLIYYLYDSLGIAGMIYNGSYYYFEKNTLGDIIRIRNSLNTIVATYSYDACGNILSQSGSMADVNPFRYRGYYYDTETGLYYLQTRYYDPSIRRFINADSYELVPQLAQVLGQLNLYAYCNNNPIMYTDENGESFIVALIAVIVCRFRCMVSFDPNLRTDVSNFNLTILMNKLF